MDEQVKWVAFLKKEEEKPLKSARTWAAQTGIME